MKTKKKIICENCGIKCTGDYYKNVGVDWNNKYVPLCESCHNSNIELLNKISGFSMEFGKHIARLSVEHLFVGFGSIDRD